MLQQNMQRKNRGVQLAHSQFTPIFLFVQFFSKQNKYIVLLLQELRKEAWSVTAHGRATCLHVTKKPLWLHVYQLLDQFARKGETAIQAVLSRYGNILRVRVLTRLVLEVVCRSRYWLMCQKCERNDQPVRSARLVLYSCVHCPQQRSSGYVILSRDWMYLAHPFGAVGNM